MDLLQVFHSIRSGMPIGWTDRVRHSVPWFVSLGGITTIMSRARPQSG
jgi:hypothetical protein